MPLWPAQPLQAVGLWGQPPEGADPFAAAPPLPLQNLCACQVPAWALRPAAPEPGCPSCPRNCSLEAAAHSLEGSDELRNCVHLFTLASTKGNAYIMCVRTGGVRGVAVFCAALRSSLRWRPGGRTTPQIGASPTNQATSWAAYTLGTKTRALAFRAPVGMWVKPSRVSASTCGKLAALQRQPPFCEHAPHLTWRHIGCVCVRLLW